MPGPLAGTKIIEMAGLGAGPFCAMLLADMGAEVIRVEQKPNARRAPIKLVPERRFDVLARGRRSLAIDLKCPGAVDTLLELVGRADALVESFRPGVMERLGLGPDVCLDQCPALVYGRMTGWGQDGPLAHTAGHDVDYIALSGALHAIGDRDRPPSIPMNLVGDFGGGGLVLAFGVVCALLEAKASGRGQVVDAAMAEGAALLASMMYGLHAAGSWSNRRGDNLLDGGAPFYHVYTCADGRHVAVGALEPQFYALLRDRCGIDDPAFDARDARDHWPELQAKLATLFRTRTRAQWSELLEGSDACVAPVLDWDEAPHHPHHEARHAFVDIAGVIQPAPTPRFSRTPPATPRPPAEVGEHTADILADWGIDAERIEGLRRHGAI